jgi:hypothetical protein
VSQIRALWRVVAGELGATVLLVLVTVLSGLARSELRSVEANRRSARRRRPGHRSQTLPVALLEASANRSPALFYEDIFFEAAQSLARRGDKLAIVRSASPKELARRLVPELGTARVKQLPAMPTPEVLADVAERLRRVLPPKPVTSAWADLRAVTRGRMVPPRRGDPRSEGTIRAPAGRARSTRSAARGRPHSSPREPDVAQTAGCDDQPRGRRYVRQWSGARIGVASFLVTHDIQ